MPTGRQIRAARGLLGWSAGTLGERIGLSHTTIKNIETGANKRPLLETIDKIVFVFNQAGIEFTDREGVCCRPKDIEIFDGPDRFKEFLESTYLYLEKFGGEVCISVTDEHDLQMACSGLSEHRAKMTKLRKTKGITGRVLACEGEFISSWAEMRKQDMRPHMPKVSFYTFGDNFALISFGGDPSPHVVLHKTSPFTAAYKAAFDAAWEKAEVRNDLRK